MNAFPYPLKPWSLSIHFSSYLIVVVHQFLDLHLQVLGFLQSRNNRIEHFSHFRDLRCVGFPCHRPYQSSQSSFQLVDLFRLHFSIENMANRNKQHLKRTDKSRSGHVRSHNVRTPNHSNINTKLHDMFLLQIVLTITRDFNFLL